MRRADTIVFLLTLAALIGVAAFSADVEAGVWSPRDAGMGRAAVHARPAQQPLPPPGGGNGPNDPPDKIQRGTTDGAPAGGAAIIESGRNYALEYAIVLILAGAALGAVCKSSHRA